jgi:molecular chaperone DnaK
MEASMKLGEAIYKAEAAQAAEAENAETGGASKPDDDVVDADFEEGSCCAGFPGSIHSTL